MMGALLGEPIIISDLDNTLSNASWRQPWAQEGNWDKFHEHVELDPPIKPNIDLLVRERMCAAAGKYCVKIVILTGRPEKYRKNTERWLSKYGVPYDLLLMRPDGMFASDYVYKCMMLDRHIADLGQVLYVLEDRDSVVKAFRAMGLTVYQVAEGAY